MFCSVLETDCLDELVSDELKADRESKPLVHRRFLSYPSQAREVLFQQEMIIAMRMRASQAELSSVGEIHDMR